MRRVLVVGASGRTGAALVRKAALRGLEVRALSRRPVEAAPSGVAVFTGDALDARAVTEAVRGCDTVLCVLGPDLSSPSDLCRRCTRNLVEAMRATHAARLVCVTGAMIGCDDEQLGWLYRSMRHRPAVAASLVDRREQERLVCESGLAWTLIRPPRLTDGPERPVHEGETLHVGALASISRESLARFVLDVASDPAFALRAITVSE